MPATRDGWWIRVNPDPAKTECDSIDLAASHTGMSPVGFATWGKGGETDFDLPPDLVNTKKVHVSATVQPNGKNGWLCVFYKDHGVQHMWFDNHEWHDLGQTDTDPECNGSVTPPVATSGVMPLGLAMDPGTQFGPYKGSLGHLIPAGATVTSVSNGSSGQTELWLTMVGVTDPANPVFLAASGTSGWVSHVFDGKPAAAQWSANPNGTNVSDVTLVIEWKL